MRLFSYILCWCAAVVFTRYSIRFWMEVGELGFLGVYAVRAVCSTFLAVTGWIGLVIETAKLRAKPRHTTTE